MSEPENAVSEPAPTPVVPPALGLRDLIRYLYARGVTTYAVPASISAEQLTGEVETTLVQITLDEAAPALGMTPFELTTAAARWCGENPAPTIQAPNLPGVLEIRSAEEAERLFGRGTELGRAAASAFRRPAPPSSPAETRDIHPARLEVAENLRAIAAGIVGLGSAVGFARRWALRHGVVRVADALESAVNRVADVTERAVERVVVRPVVDVTMRLAARVDGSPEPLDAQREAVLAGAYGPKKGDVPPVVRLG